VTLAFPFRPHCYPFFINLRIIKQHKSQIFQQRKYVAGYGENMPSDNSPNGKRFIMIKEFTTDMLTEETSQPKKHHPELV